MTLKICTCDCHDVNVFHEFDHCDCCQFPFLRYKNGNLIDVKYYASEVAKRSVEYYKQRAHLHDYAGPLTGQKLQRANRPGRDVEGD